MAKITTDNQSSSFLSVQSLLIKFLLGAFVLISLIVSYGYFNFAANQLLKDLDQELNVSSRILLELSQLREKSQQYKLNAPRDWDSYNRDVAVFYKDFSKQINDINNDFSILSGLAISPSPFASYGDYNQRIEYLSETNRQLKSQWEEFETQLSEKIGSRDEPRLEWGAEYIIENIGNLTRNLQSANDKAQALSLEFEEFREIIALVMMTVIIVYLLITFLLMIFHVIKPVMNVAESCEIAASGEYGLQVDENASGEIKRLQKAFNELSSRSQLMMELVNTSHQGDSTRERISNIFNSGHKALGVNWIGLIALGEEQAQLANSSPALLDDGWRHRTISLHKAFGRELVASFEEQWLQIKDISKLALQRHDERFLRELHHNTFATEVAGFPFKCPKQHNFILLFSTPNEGGFNKKQLKLLRSLTSQMADNIVSSFD